MLHRSLTDRNKDGRRTEPLRQALAKLIAATYPAKRYRPTEKAVIGKNDRIAGFVAVGQRSVKL
jgi:hypothetical protein